MKTTKIKKRQSKKNSIMGSFLVFLLFAGLPASLPASGTTQAVHTEQIEAEILSEDWKKIVETIVTVDDRLLSPEFRLIKGHACLAMNRNNESLCLFLSASSDDNLRKWRQWTEDFEDKYPSSGIAHYLRGDALARLEEWDEALHEFRTALDIHPNHPLILNARGVAYACLKEWHKSRIDFDESTKQQEICLADSYANIGALRIQKKDGAEGALAAFNKALEIDPDFALALHGRGCVELVLNKYSEAEKDLIRAENNGRCRTDFLMENLLNIEAFMNGMKKDEMLAMLTGKKVSMSLSKRLEDYKQHAGGILEQYFANRIVSDIRTMPTQRREAAMNSVTQWIDKNPYEGKFLSSNFENIMKYNSRTGMGNILTPGSFEAYMQAGKWPVEGGIKGIFNGMKEIPKGNYDVAKGILQKLPSQHADGVLASFAGAIWDEGEWPFDAFYGLLYGNKSIEISSAKGRLRK